MSVRNKIDCRMGRGYQASRVITPVKCKFTYRQLLVKVCSLPQIEFRKGPGEDENFVFDYFD